MSHSRRIRFSSAYNSAFHYFMESQQDEETSQLLERLTLASREGGYSSVYNTDVNLAIKLIGPMVEMLGKARKNPEATLLLNYLLAASVEGTISPNYTDFTSYQQDWSSGRNVAEKWKRYFPYLYHSRRTTQWSIIRDDNCGKRCWREI